MEFALDEGHEMFRKMVRDFVAREVEPDAARLDETGEFPWGHIKKMAALGLTGLTIDEEYGGSGGDSLMTALAVEELARGCPATSLILIASLSLGTSAIHRAGTQEQKRKYLPPLARGEALAAFALTEPGAGSDAGALQTTATRQGDFYLLNGSKAFISNGDVARTLVVFATVDRSLKHKGIAGFIVEQGTPGLTPGRPESKMGMRAASTVGLTFEDCPVPASHVLGGVGGGFRLAIEIIDASRVVVAAQGVGIAQGCLDAALDYAQGRIQFGQPIASFQAIQWMLADMATAVEAARLLTYKAAYLKDRGLPFIKEAAMAKLFATEAANTVAHKAVQIHGGYGYIRGYAVERYYRDARATEIYEGTSEVQRMTIARHLLAHP